MYAYEIFTHGYSRIIRADSLIEAVKEFLSENTIDDIIAVVNKEHPIASEFGIR
jgi:hypothetical protein